MNERDYYHLIKENDLAGLESALAANRVACHVTPYGQSLVLHAVLERKHNILTFLIGKGCDINGADANGLTPLHAAALKNDATALEILLNAGAQIEAEDKFGNSPLFSAISEYRNDSSAISVLLKRGANPLHKCKTGISPLEFAQKAKMTELVDLLRDQAGSGEEYLGSNN